MQEATTEDSLAVVGSKRKLTSPTRKKQTSACDGCRKGKTRCDGKSPCSRCLKRNINCVYSPQKRRGVRKRVKGDEQEITEQVVEEEQQCYHNLLDIFFNYINMFLLRPLHREELELYQTNKSVSMQYNVALAFAARSIKQKKLAESFEKQARLFAGELFDDFTPESATAFSMLTCYYWSQDQARSLFYSSITQAICKQIGPSIDPAAVLLIEAMSTCCVVTWNSYVNDLLNRLRSILAVTSDGQLKKHVKIVTLLLEVKYGLIQSYPITDEQKILAILFSPENLQANLTPKHATILLDKINTAESLLNYNEKYPTIWPLIDVFFNYFRSMLYYAKLDNQTAELIVKKIIDSCDKSQNLYGFVPPAIVQCVHYSFCVAYISGDVPLAVKAIDLLRTLSHSLPVAEIPLWGDTRRLKALLNQTSINAFNTNSILDENDIHQFIATEDATVSYSPLPSVASSVSMSSNLASVSSNMSSIGSNLAMASMGADTAFLQNLSRGMDLPAENFRGTIYEHFFHPINQDGTSSQSDPNLSRVLFS